MASSLLTSDLEALESQWQAIATHDVSEDSSEEFEKVFRAAYDVLLSQRYFRLAEEQFLERKRYKIDKYGLQPKTLEPFFERGWFEQPSRMRCHVLFLFERPTDSDLLVEDEERLFNLEDGFYAKELTRRCDRLLREKYNWPEMRACAWYLVPHAMLKTDDVDERSRDAPMPERIREELVRWCARYIKLVVRPQTVVFVGDGFGVRTRRSKEFEDEFRPLPVSPSVKNSAEYESLSLRPVEGSIGVGRKRRRCFRLTLVNAPHLYVVMRDAEQHQLDSEVSLRYQTLFSMLGRRAPVKHENANELLLLESRRQQQKMKTKSSLPATTNPSHKPNDSSSSTTTTRQQENAFERMMKDAREKRLEEVRMFSRFGQMEETSSREVKRARWANVRSIV